MGEARLSFWDLICLHSFERHVCSLERDHEGLHRCGPCPQHDVAVEWSDLDESNEWGDFLAGEGHG